MKAWEFLDKPEKWCKHYCAITADGNPTYSKGQDAVSWCLLGVLMLIYSDDAEYFNVTDKVWKTLPKENKCGFSIWNDAPERTFEEVRNLLKEADV